MFGVGRDSGDHLVQPPAKSRFTQSRLHRMTYRQSWTSPEETPQSLWTAPASALSSIEPLPSRSGPHLHGCMGFSCLSCQTPHFLLLSFPEFLSSLSRSVLFCPFGTVGWHWLSSFPPLLLDLSKTHLIKDKLILLKHYSKQDLKEPFYTQ